MMALILAGALAIDAGIGLLRRPFTWIDWSFWLSMLGLCVVIYWRGDETAAWVKQHRQTSFWIWLSVVIFNLVAVITFGDVFLQTRSAWSGLQVVFNIVMLVLFLHRLIAAARAGIR